MKIKITVQKQSMLFQSDQVFPWNIADRAQIMADLAGTINPQMQVQVVDRRPLGYRRPPRMRLTRAMKRRLAKFVSP